MCTSTQRLYVHADIQEEFTHELLRVLAGFKVGDPRCEDTDVGPMISEEAAIRAEAWVREAEAAGARIIAGGHRRGPVLQPTVLTHVSASMRVMCEEIFAPVASIVPFRTLDDVVREVNALPYGLAAGLFTRDLTVGLRAARQLRVGVLHLNDSSSSRVDLLPFAGVKGSGMGREGPRYAMREMTEERLITISLL